MLKTYLHTYYARALYPFAFICRLWTNLKSNIEAEPDLRAENKPQLQLQLLPSMPHLFIMKKCIGAGSFRYTTSLENR